MERFVFIAAVTFAVIFGAVALLGRGHFNIEIDGEGGGPKASIVETAPGRMEPQAFAGTRLRIRNAAARINITPEDRQDFLIEIDNPGQAPMPQVHSDDGRVVIDGQLRGRVADCLDNGGADLRGYGERTAEQLPLITIHAPRALDISVRAAGITQIGPSESLDLDFSGCGAATVADVAGAMSVDLAGSGTVTGGAARSLTADVAGSGDVALGAVAEGADIDIAGSGSLTIESLSGDLSADGAGSGVVIVRGGTVNRAKVDLAGSGRVDITAPVQRLETAILGSGEVNVHGAVGDLDAEVAGSGTVNVDAVTGTAQREILGSGSVNIGE